jgi:hypothetical protein
VPVDIAEYYIGKKYLHSYDGALRNSQPDLKTEERKGLHNSVQPLVGQSLLIGCNGCSEESVAYLSEMLSKVAAIFLNAI